MMKKLTVIFFTKSVNSDVEELYVNGILISRYNINSKIGKNVDKLLKRTSEFGGVF